MLDLRAMRDAKNISQISVAKKCGITNAFLSQIERGRRQPSVTTAKNIAAVLDFDWTQFFEDESENPE